MSSIPAQTASTAVKSALSTGFVMDLLQSKKFRVLALLIALWSNPLHEYLHIDLKAMPWITCAFVAFIVSQGVRDAAREFRGKPSSDQTETP